MPLLDSLGGGGGFETGGIPGTLGGITGGVIGGSLATGAALVLNGISMLLQKKPSSGSSLANSGRTVTFRQAAASWRLIFGQARVGGVMAFVHTTGTNNEYVHIVIMLAGHQVHAISAMYFDGVAVPLDGSGNATGTYAGFVHAEFGLGTTGQTAFAGLVAAAPAYWTASHRLRGRACAYVQLKWDEKLFTSGIPNITFDVQGAEMLDTRTSTTGYSENVAVAIRNYLTNTTYGLSVASGDIDATSFEAAADICDQAVSLAAGGTEPRYTCNGVADSSEKPGDILNKLLTACAGRLVYVNGKWQLYAGAWIAPTVTLTDDDLIGSITVRTRLTKRELFNGVKGTIVSAANKWQPGDFPPIVNATYLAEDNGERIWKDIELPFTISMATAQRLAKIELERARRQITAILPCGLSAYKLQPPDTVNFTHDRFSWSAKSFEIASAQFALMDDNGAPTLGFATTLREADSTIYDWSSAEEGAVPAVSTSVLPNPSTIAAPTSFAAASSSSTVVTKADGSVAAAVKLTWTVAADQFVQSGGYYQIEYKKHVDSTWTPSTPAPGDKAEAYITKLDEAVSYDFRIRSVNTMGARSTDVTVSSHTVATTNSALKSVGLAPNAAPNITNDATVDSIDAGASATIRVYGSGGGPGTSWTRTTGSVDTTYASASLTGKSYTTPYWVNYDGSSFTAQTTYKASLNDAYIFSGKVTTVAAGGGGGSSGGGGTGGGGGGGHVLP